MLINAANRTVLVTVPLSTSRTGTLTPVISHNGAAVSPASGAGQSFFSAAAYTPVEYTVTAADGSAAVWTVMVRLDSSSLNSVSAVSTYLSSNTAPVFLPVSLNLADSSGNGWNDLLTAIQTGNKFVALDLSACTMTGTEFDPDAADTNTARIEAKGKIVSLVLPDTATSVKAGADYFNPIFKHFGALKSIAAAGVTGIGDWAFFGCDHLEKLSLPSVTTIGVAAFANCTSLTSLSLPAATSIRLWAFDGCTGLTSLSLPSVTTIGVAAFANCTGLTTVSLPAVQTISGSAFFGCTGLSSVKLPAATSIGGNAFAYTGTQALTVTLGSTAPTLGDTMFYNVTADKAVTVKVSSGATGYGTISETYDNTDNTSANWGNAFRGGGWNGSAMTDSSKVNSSITLTVQYLP